MLTSSDSLSDYDETTGGEETQRIKNRKPKKPKLFLVTGGAGFVGRHVVEYLLNGNEKVRVFDKQRGFIANNPRLESFILGDVSNFSDVLEACRGVDCVFHLASLTNPWAPPTLYTRINVKGTENIIRACCECDVTQLIYTSTSSVVLDGNQCQGGDESMRYPKRHLDRYSQSKCKAEQAVLAANDAPTKSNLRLATCALRPHSIFGPGDTHFIAQLITKARQGDITHIIGEGTNIADFTYVDNVVYAHALAAEQLVNPQSKPAGQVYFITNGEPTLFWAFVSRILSEVGCVGPTKYISFRVAYIFAVLMEFFYWIMGWVFGWKPLITRQMVITMACHHWFSHEKATRDLGYKPIVTLEDGIKQTAEFFSKRRNIKSQSRVVSTTTTSDTPSQQRVSTRVSDSNTVNQLLLSTYGVDADIDTPVDIPSYEAYDPLGSCD